MFRAPGSTWGQIYGCSVAQPNSISCNVKSRMRPVFMSVDNGTTQLQRASHRVRGRSLPKRIQKPMDFPTNLIRLDLMETTPAVNALVKSGFGYADALTYTNQGKLHAVELVKC